MEKQPSDSTTPAAVTPETKQQPSTEPSPAPTSAPVPKQPVPATPAPVDTPPVAETKSIPEEKKSPPEPVEVAKPAKEESTPVAAASTATEAKAPEEEKKPALSSPPPPCDSPPREERRLLLSPKEMDQLRAQAREAERESAPPAKDESPEQQIQRQFVILDSSSPAQASKVNPAAIFTYWKVHKEQFARLKEWENQRHMNMIATKALLDTVCDCIFMSLKTAISNNKALSKYFTSLVAAFTNFAKQTSKVSEALKPIRTLHARAAGPEWNFFQNAEKAELDQAKGAGELARYVEGDILADLKEGVRTYEQSFRAQRETFPTLSKVWIDRLMTPGVGDSGL